MNKWNSYIGTAEWRYKSKEDHLWYRCSTLTNCARKPTGSWSLNWFVIYPGNWDENHHEIMNMWISWWSTWYKSVNNCGQFCLSLLENNPLETGRPLKNWASLHQIRQLNLSMIHNDNTLQKILLLTCKHGLISTAGRTIICYTFSNKEMTDCVYIFIAPSLAMMQTRSRCFSSLRVRINDSVMLKFGCSSLKNKQPKLCHENHNELYLPVKKA